MNEYEPQNPPSGLLISSRLLYTGIGYCHKTAPDKDSLHTACSEAALETTKCASDLKTQRQRKDLFHLLKKFSSKYFLDILVFKIFNPHICWVKPGWLHHLMWTVNKEYCTCYFVLDSECGCPHIWDISASITIILVYATRRNSLAFAFNTKTSKL